jgi:isopenicillin N synthase-like dioxygenase
MSVSPPPDAQISRATSRDVPIIDIRPLLAGEPGALDSVAQQFRDACTDIGFFFIVNHGLDPALVERSFEASRELFALPADAKRAVRMNQHQCGFQPSKVAMQNTGLGDGSTVKPNANEAFKYTHDLPPTHPDYRGGRRFVGHNQWPAGLSASARQVLQQYLEAFDALGRQLLPVVAVALGAPPDRFDAGFAETSSVVRLAWYPVLPVDEDQFGSRAHTDMSFLTMIPPATAPGLQILLQDGTWLDQPHVPGGIVVNTGMALRRWANDRLIATPHRVLASKTGDRFSNIFFFYPSVDAVMAPICAPGTAPNYDPITFSAHHASYATANFAYAEGKAGQTP